MNLQTDALLLGALMASLSRRRGYCDTCALVSFVISSSGATARRTGSASRRGDDDLAGGPSLADAGEGLGHLVKPDGAHRSVSGSKWGGPSLTASTPSRRPVTYPVAAPGEHGPMSDQVQDEVVRLAVSCEVLASVVDHLIGTERPHELELRRVVHAGDVRTQAFRQLNREATLSPRRHR